MVIAVGNGHDYGRQLYFTLFISNFKLYPIFLNPSFLHGTSTRKKSTQIALFKWFIQTITFVLFVSVSRYTLRAFRVFFYLIRV